MDLFFFDYNVYILILYYNFTQVDMFMLAAKEKPQEAAFGIS